LLAGPPENEVSTKKDSRARDGFAVINIRSQSASHREVMGKGADEGAARIQNANWPFLIDIVVYC